MITTMLNTKIVSKKFFYVLGISGGPDSMCLLNEMSRLGYSFLVAHVNYKKRPESDKEEELVEKFCQGLRLPFFSSKINPEEYLFVKNFQS